MLAEQPRLAGGDLVFLDGVLGGVIEAQVLGKVARGRGRDLDRLSGHTAKYRDRFRFTNQARYCVSLATVFPDLTNYTAVPPSYQRRCGGSRSIRGSGV
jgi:hypothetical protein